MGTLYYKPIDLSYMVPGITPIGGGSVPPLWSRLGDLDRWINTTHTPQLFGSTFGTNAGGYQAAVTNAASGSPDTLGRWIIMGNAARRPVTVYADAAVDNPGTTGTLTVTYGGATVTQAVTATSIALHTITITPTTGTAPLELKITGHTDDSNYLALFSACAVTAQTDLYAGGIGSDGYAPLGDSFNTDSYSTTSPVADNKPITTELVSRAWNNTRAIARDRVACLASFQRAQNNTARPWWATTEGTPQLSAMLWVPPSDSVTRDYRLSWYTQASGDAEGTGVVVADGSQTHSTAISAAGGWTHDTISLSPLGGSIAFYVVKTAGTGFLGVSAAMVFREP